jgi:hypothetical protein
MGEHRVPAFNHWRHESNVASFESIGVWIAEKCESAGATLMRGCYAWIFIGATKLSLFWISRFAPRSSES